MSQPVVKSPAYFRDDFHLLTAGSVKTDELRVRDRWIIIGGDNVSASRVDQGLVLLVRRTGVSDTAAVGGFTAGTAGVSNPTLATTGASTFSSGDIVYIENSRENEGLYEVSSHTGGVLTVKGVGTVSTTVTFARTDFRYWPYHEGITISAVVAASIKLRASGNAFFWNDGTDPTSAGDENIATRAYPYPDSLQQDDTDASSVNIDSLGWTTLGPSWSYTTPLATNPLHVLVEIGIMIQNTGSNPEISFRLQNGAAVEYGTTERAYKF